jgi:hypothetical protein
VQLRSITPVPVSTRFKSMDEVSNFLINATAGAIGAAVGVYVGSPFDVIKVSVVDLFYDRRCIAINYNDVLRLLRHER